MQRQVARHPISSPLVAELNANARKYVASQGAFKALVSKYEHAFEEEFMDTAYKKQNDELRAFHEESGRLVKNLETLYSVPGELDAYLRKIEGRIDAATVYPLMARKYLEAHRFNCGDIKEYFENISCKMERELDELVEEAKENNVVFAPSEEELGKRRAERENLKEYEEAGEAGRDVYNYLDDDVSVGEMRYEDYMDEESEERTRVQAGDEGKGGGEGLERGIEDELEDILKEVERDNELKGALNLGKNLGSRNSSQQKKNEPPVSLMNTLHSRGANKNKIDFV